jgi:hypothetical protein
MTIQAFATQWRDLFSRPNIQQLAGKKGVPLPDPAGLAAMSDKEIIQLAVRNTNVSLREAQSWILESENLEEWMGTFAQETQDDDADDIRSDSMDSMLMERARRMEQRSNRPASHVKLQATIGSAARLPRTSGRLHY